MQKRTKIVATLGPSSSSDEVIEKLILAGADVFRLNFSHGEASDHIARAESVRRAAKKHGRFVAILGDLQGPKIRIARFKEQKVHLDVGQTFTLNASLATDDGDKDQVGIDYQQLINDGSPGDILLLDDGRIELEVTEKHSDRLVTRVVVGGWLSNNKGINRQGGGLSARALTDKDKEDIKLAASMKVDYLAVSFPRDAHDMNEARELLTAAGGSAGLVSKIERAECVQDDQTLDDIIMASDAVMVARGDLAVEIGDAELVGVQKRIISRSRQLNKPVITATQMMESMIASPMPTRAEVSDVANAVLDYTDAVMLSAETAAGDYPVETVEAMSRIIIGAERNPLSKRSRHRLHQDFHDMDETIALSAVYAANHLIGCKAIISLTESGATPRLMSRLRSHLPIYAFARREDTQNRVALYRGVQPVDFHADEMEPDAINPRAISVLKERGCLESGDIVVITRGEYLNAQGGTNTMKIYQVD
ncbi:MAG: pyruvate kinase [Oceanospirillaceae bacterium]|nr:pyruvate kinase [Oceanospirillaceae bacterium]MBT12716.1 pyruvate kinase [Oceanospirillaceae bacterium]|tara:strand:+ start:112242 stop:113678 length:1437 start_codon:yes stop_codon:yes gene_type:complete